MSRGRSIPAGFYRVVPVEQITVRQQRSQRRSRQRRAVANVPSRGQIRGRSAPAVIRRRTLACAGKSQCAASAGRRVSVSQPANVCCDIDRQRFWLKPGEPILPHQIRPSNAYAIVAGIAQARLFSELLTIICWMTRRAQRLLKFPPGDRARRPRPELRRLHWQTLNFVPPGGLD